MRTLAQRSMVSGLLVALAGVPVLHATGEEKPKSFTFRAPPVNSLGLKSLADLRGRPVLIDYWGTR